jgi:hypothetical protein
MTSTLISIPFTIFCSFGEIGDSVTDIFSQSYGWSRKNSRSWCRGIRSTIRYTTILSLSDTPLTEPGLLPHAKSSRLAAITEHGRHANPSLDHLKRRGVLFCHHCTGLRHTGSRESIARLLRCSDPCALLALPQEKNFSARGKSDAVRSSCILSPNCG